MPEFCTNFELALDWYDQFEASIPVFSRLWTAIAVLRDASCITPFPKTVSNDRLGPNLGLSVQYARKLYAKELSLH
jgi:hypothetical protein